MLAMRMRKSSLRLRGHDYAQPAGYFVTFNVLHRERLLGQVTDGNMHLSAIGAVVADTWLWLAQRYPYVRLDVWVVMPDHFHGILVIDHDHASAKPLGQLIAAFKTVSTRKVNDIRQTPSLQLWQRSYHDVVIRNDGSIDRIRLYIANNPAKWANRVSS